jgi:Fe2+ or Zn2+ uptake regulation protein
VRVTGSVPAQSLLSRFDLFKTTCIVALMTFSGPSETATLADAVRAAGLKVTAPRLAVLGMLQNAPHSSAEDVFADVRGKLPTTSVQAVYGVLAAFTSAGLVRRTDPAGSPALFECRVGDNHHHILCVRCGDLRDVNCVIGAAPCLTPSDTSGFTVIAAEVTFTGVCASCQLQPALE